MSSSSYHFTEMFTNSIVEFSLDGIISIDDLGSKIRSYGMNPTDDEVQEMVNGVLQSDKNTIDFPEFLIIVSKYLKDDEMFTNIKNCYTKLNTDVMLSISEFKNIINLLVCKNDDMIWEDKYVHRLKSIGALGEYYTPILGEKVVSFLKTNTQTIDCDTFTNLLMSIVCKSDGRCSHIYGSGENMGCQCWDTRNKNSTYCKLHYKKKSNLYKCISKLKSSLTYTTIPNRYTLTCLIKNQDFWKWYCGQGMGKDIDHSRILGMKCVKD